MRLIGFWLIWLIATATPAAPPVAVEFKTPPPFGYGVGSVIRHQVELFVPAPWQLDIAQLPTKGPLNPWLEIRDFAYEHWQQTGGNRYRLRIDYQIFPSLPQALTLEIPSLPLPLTAPAGKQQTISIPAWAFTAHPLIPPQWSDAQVEVRPLWQPKEADLDRHKQRLVRIGIALLLASAVFVWRSARKRRLPFAKALPKVCRAARQGEIEAAFRAFHQALNETAGQALFAGQLADFLTKRPAFAPLEPELKQFFQASKRFFYRLHPPPEENWSLGLVKLCQACARAEKRCR